jgi:protein-L-isoaspartate O-methyltransferase
LVQKSSDELIEQEQTVLGVLYSVSLNPFDKETNEYQLNNNKIKLDFEGILIVSKNRIGDDRDLLSSILKSLLDKSMIKFESGIYSLNESGNKIGKQVRAKWLSEFYDDELIRCAESKAYAEFCKRVYGENLLQYNVVDDKQLQMMQEKLKINSNDVVLDLGCGLGGITKYLAKKTGAQIIGIDISEKSIQYANTNNKEITNLKFEAMDINDLSYPKNNFDVILALDVLYWLDDLESVIQKIKDILKPNGRMGVFYVNFKNKENSNKPFGWEN